MSFLNRRPIVAAALAVVVFGLILAPLVARAQRRQIVLVARGMAFYVEGSPAPNPTIVVKPGERVEVVLRNEDRGLVHDFAVPGWGVATDRLSWNETDGVTFTAPDEPGIHRYVCQPHAVMMRGTIEVLAPAGP